MENKRAAVFPSLTSPPSLPPPRRLATLSTKEEFPSSITVTPAVRAAAVIKEATTSNGVKLIARDSGASVSTTLCLEVTCGLAH